MNAGELKNGLHQFISEIEDIDMLNRIKSYFQELKPSSKGVSITEYEEKKITRGLQQFENGQITSRHVVREKINRWLEEKQK